MNEQNNENIYILPLQGEVSPYDTSNSTFKSDKI
jgi:hypothetical protein